MTRRRSATPATRLATQSLELALAAPQVVAQRLTRMAVAGPSPSARDRREFSRMGSEKVLAFYQSWGAMWFEAWRAQWELAQTLSRGAFGLGAPGRAATARAFERASSRVAAAGLAPVHRKAVSNAKRLARTRR